MSTRRALDLLEEQALLNDIEESAARINAHVRNDIKVLKLCLTVYK